MNTISRKEYREPLYQSKQTPLPCVDAIADTKIWLSKIILMNNSVLKKKSRIFYSKWRRVRNLTA